jgi:hypothetical protein
MSRKEGRAMNSEPVVIQGVVREDGTLELAGKVPLPPGMVRVTVQPVPYSQETDPLFVLLRKIRAEREKAGLPTRTREEIDAQVREVRDEFDEGVAEIGRLQDECRRRRLEAEAADKEGQA